MSISDEIRNIVIAVDPGQTTGVCIIRDTTPKSNTSVDKISFDLLQSFVINWSDQVKVYKLIYNYRATLYALVIEDFILTPKGSRSMVGMRMHSSEVIGIVRLSVALLKLSDRLFFLMPDVKSNVKILQDHYSLIPNYEHTRDAYKLARYFLVIDNFNKMQAKGR